MYLCQMRKIFALFISLFYFLAASAATEPIRVSATIGQSVKASDASLTITCIDRRGYHPGKEHDADIQSPKSATFAPDGKKIYINSLEGGKTVVYDAKTLEKIKVISHTFSDGNSSLWLRPSGYYPFTHYPDGAGRAFLGKPVEATITPDGKWLIIPYYRRSFDINAQDPSAIAIIDTENDSIVAMAETGPLPKIVRVSNDGKTLVITHWGDNTVGLMDISDADPHKWKHLAPIAIGKKLSLDYSLTSVVNRDSGSGNLLRGTLFLPGDSLMLVGGMAGQTAVIDLKRHMWIGYIPSLVSVRHIAMRNGMVYFSQNTAGQVISCPVDSIVSAITRQRASSRSFTINGLRRCAVGSGARTLEPSPSGKYLFVACNSASAVYVVRTSDMSVIASIPADSFPVGLDISPDGTLLVTTSQGRKGVVQSGNAVDFYRIDYAEPEPDLSKQFEEMLAADDNVTPLPPDTPTDEESSDNIISQLSSPYAIGVAVMSALLVILLIALIVTIIRHNNRNRS